MSERLRPTQRFATGPGGVRISVWDHGGRGRPLLLAHCTGTHARVWDPLVPGLLEHFHVFSVDSRGHGDSDKPEDESAYTWTLSGQDLLAVADELDLGMGIRAVGHSGGGAYVAYAEYLRPGIFDRVILIDPILGPPEAFPKPNPLAVLTRKRVNVFPSRAEARARYAAKPPMQSWDPAALDAYVEFGFADQPDGTVALKCPGPVEAMVYEGSGIPELWGHLEELAFGGALVTASESNTRRLAELQRGRFPNLAYECLEGLGHFIPQESPERVVGLVNRYLGPK